MRRLLIVLGALILALLSIPASAAPPKSATTVVTFTFDDGWKGQEQAAAILKSAKMNGTFFVNSGQIGYPAYMTLETLQLLETQGHEIGGHTVGHEKLTDLTPAEARATVCNDRATLVSKGFRVTSFAYPHGALTDRIQDIVKECGYNSARGTSGLRNSATDCGDCPYANTIPPKDVYRIRTGTTITRLETIKKQIEAAENNGGGWVPIAFHHMTDDPAKGEERMSLADFQDLVTWVDQRPNTTQVFTVADVIGGKEGATSGEILPINVPAAPPAGPAQQQTGSSSPKAAFTVFGLGIGQGFVILTGLALTVVGAIAYRLKTKGNRYA